VVAGRLTKLIAPWGIVSAEDQWMPSGFDGREEAQLHNAPRLFRDASIGIIGVENVIGSFKKSDVVTVKDVSGNVLGRGEVRFSSEQIAEKIDRRKNGEDVELFGSEVIHCDYFVHAP
jgi:glutamate 5-kinase